MFIYSLVVGLGLAGSVLFFPVKINSEYYCLYHRSVHNKRKTDHVGSLISMDLHQETTAEEYNDQIPKLDYSCLLREYLQDSAPYYWRSIIMVVTFFLIRNSRKPGMCG